MLPSPATTRRKSKNAAFPTPANQLRGPARSGIRARVNHLNQRTAGAADRNGILKPLNPTHSTPSPRTASSADPGAAGRVGVHPRNATRAEKR